ncbi:hypothetical protein SDC9_178126 [bioreactor metagenome]|uniref:Uncharacterized protein n=1 Tax=bioreactor metagenome TaxID=1076179 RepID=A0A645GV38_9ZZZZ
MRKPVGTVRSDLNRVDGVLFDIVAQWSADRPILRKNHQSVVVAAQSQLLRAAHHPGGFHAAKLAFIDDEFLAVLGVLEDSPERGQRHHASGVAIGRAADDLLDVSVSGVHLADGKMIGVRVRFAAQNLRHDHAGGNFADRRNLLDFQSGHRQRLGQFLGRLLQFNIVFQPIQRNFHFRILPLRTV